MVLAAATAGTAAVRHGGAHVMTAGKRTVQIELGDHDALAIESLLETCSTDDRATSHGELTIETLAAMLLEDCALAERRPGSWEGAGMIDVLRCHGYLQ